jgi:hypothetical protein
LVQLSHIQLLALVVLVLLWYATDTTKTQIYGFKNLNP